MIEEETEHKEYTYIGIDEERGEVFLEELSSSEEIDWLFRFC